MYLLKYFKNQKRQSNFISLFSSSTPVSNRREKTCKGFVRAQKGFDFRVRFKPLDKIWQVCKFGQKILIHCQMPFQGIIDWKICYSYGIPHTELFCSKKFGQLFELGFTILGCRLFKLFLKKMFDIRIHGILKGGLISESFFHPLRNLCQI